MMRVLFIAGYNHPAYHRKVELLADVPDVEILHISISGYGKDPGRYLSANGQRSYGVQTFPAHWLGQPGDAHRGFLWPPHYCMGQFKPHIIHSESDVETLGTAEIALARWVLAHRGKLIEYSWQNVFRPRSLPVYLLSAMTLRAADHIVCASQEAVAVLRQQGYRGGVSIMPLVGLDARYFYPKPVPELRARLGLQGIVIGYVGRLIPAKGVDTLLYAFARLAAPAQLLILGSGIEKNNLRALAESLDVADRCHFVDHVNYDSVADYINAMDVLVLPSRTTTQWKEQFGRVLMEAMGCKVAVVGSDSGAIPEVIDKAGYIFPEGNVDALAAILNRLTTDASVRQKIAECGYRHVLANYGVEHLAEQVLQIWRGLCPLG
jgi:glycosyltransferase involved in cell wall biosynthesis